MGFRLSFRIGPVRYSQRLGRTQAQKRAAAKGRAQRSAAKAEARRRADPEVQAGLAALDARMARTFAGPVTVTYGGRMLAVTDPVKGTITLAAPDDRFALLHDGDVVVLTGNLQADGLEAFEVRYYADGRDAVDRSVLNQLRSQERARLFGGAPLRVSVSR